MNQLECKMEKFLEEGQATLKALKTTANTLKWLYGGVIVVLLALYTDTRIDVVKKVDVSQLNEYVSKKEAITAHKYNADNIQRIAEVLIEDENVIEIIERFNKAYLENIQYIYSN